MGTARRFVIDESGMTLPLVMIMIVLIGVMGAGLLTFVSSDLNTVVEENRGQRAFEVADAGIGAAKRQLSSDCIGSTTCSAHYDGGDDDLQWSAAKGGLTLEDLDGVGGTADNVNVKITAIDANSFRAISTGTFGVDTRKIEAMFEGGAGGGGGGGNVTFPTGWTPSNILLKGPNVHLNAMSMFTERNIIIDGVTNETTCETTTTGRPPRETTTTTCTNPWTNFQNEYDGNGGTFDISGTRDDLKDWDSRNLTPSGTWNIVGRKKLDNNGNPILVGNYNQTAYEKSGFAAEGLVCGTTTTTSHVPKCVADADSIADGHYAYDRTTGSKLAWDTTTNTYSKPYGQRVPFLDDPNQSSSISYPFPHDPAPDPVRLKQAALDSDTYYKALDGDTFYKPADPSTLYTWDDLVPNGNNDEVVFIDAQNHDLTYDIGSSRNGIIVAWCGNLRITNTPVFQGIVLAMKGDGTALPNDPGGAPSTTCVDDKGVLTTDNSTLKAWLYSNNNSDTTPGIQIGQNTTLYFMPNGNFNLLDVVLQDPVMTSINLKGWRELYE